MRNKDRQRANAAEPEASETPTAQPQGDGEPGTGDTATPETSASAAPMEQPASGGQLAEQRDKYLRLAAEYDNFRKRTAKERLEAGARGQAELAAKLLEGLDDLQRFADVDPATTDSQTLHKGIEMVEQKLLKALSSVGLELINPVDQSFDPNLHEAVATEPALSEEDDHTVARVFQAGYRFNGQLLRPARVVVKQWQG